MREQTVIIFQNFTQESVGCEDGCVPRVAGIRRDWYAGSFGDMLAYRERLMSISHRTSTGEGLMDGTD